MADQSTYSLKFEFLDQDPKYALGFEAGRVYQRLKHGQLSWVYVHTENVEQLTRIADCLCYNVQCRDASDGWTEMVFTNRPAATESAKPSPETPEMRRK